jgi:ParB family chromosome partitioning protein
LPLDVALDHVFHWDRTRYTAFWDAPLDQVVAGRWQPRKHFDDTKLAELAASIQKHGVQNRLLVFQNERGQLELIAGERRWRAARLVGRTTVPVELKELSARQIQELATLDNVQRDDLSAAEEGQSYEDLIARLGVSEAELARRLGIPRTRIQQRRAIASAAPEVQAALAGGELTFSQARGICAGAPGNYTAQIAALKAVRDEARRGQQPSERAVQALAQKEVLKSVKKTLADLGWQIAEHQLVADRGSVQIWVWAAGERPRAWTGAELQAAAREQRRPTMTPPATAAITNAHTASWERHGYHRYSDHVPWVFLCGAGSDVRVLAPDEVAAFVADLDAQFAAMQQRYSAAGWTLKHTNSQQFEARSAQQRVERPWRWPAVVALIGTIEAGKIDAKPVPVKATAHRMTCARCQQQMEDYTYTYIGYACRPCAKTIEAERAARVQACRTALAAQWGAWLEAAPRAALELLVRSNTHYQNLEYIGLQHGDADRWMAQIATLDDARLRAALVAQFVDRATNEVPDWVAQHLDGHAVAAKAVGAAEDS